MTAHRHPDPEPRLSAGEALSSFVDGECPPGVADEACRRWRSDPALQRAWQTYHLIGDVLRSDELSPARPGDAAFLQGLRERLAAEPVPLSPAPLPAAAPARVPRPRWRVPAAMVAGVMAVGTAVVALRPDGPGRPSGWDAPLVAAPPTSGLRTVAGSAPSASQSLMAVDGQVIRDARLDAYFEAHRGAVGPVPSAMPGGALRSVEVLVPRR
jgi:sigma-E factor negative regulatory protein RseA